MIFLKKLFRKNWLDEDSILLSQPAIEPKRTIEHYPFPYHPFPSLLVYNFLI